MRWLRPLLLLLALVLIPTAAIRASEAEKPVARIYRFSPPAPAKQEVAGADAKSAGCISCHTKSDAATMHMSPAVRLGCTDCHGGDPAIRGDPTLAHDAPAYVAAREAAHVLPRYPESWHYPSSANP